MGGPRSGTWHRLNKKDTVEEHKTLDVRYLQREGWLYPVMLYSLNWTRGGEPSGSIQVKMGHDAITLMYRHKRYGQNLEEVNQLVYLTWTPTHFGGQRPWFICGNCGRRVAVLYGAGKYFACRHCYDLTYRSSQESDSRVGRFWRNVDLSDGIGNVPFNVLMRNLKRRLKEEDWLEKERNKRKRGRPRKPKEKSL
jgi:hypothetical protein